LVCEDLSIYALKQVVSNFPTRILGFQGSDGSKTYNLKGTKASLISNFRCPTFGSNIFRATSTNHAILDVSQKGPDTNHPTHGKRFFESSQLLLLDIGL
jgi:hypothetical protein